MRNRVVSIGLLLSLFSSFQAFANQCTDIFEDIFTHGVASYSNSGKITFEANSEILTYIHSDDEYYYPSTYPGREIDFNSREDKTRWSYPKSCGEKRCILSGDLTPTLDLGNFQSTDSNSNRNISTAVTLSSGDYGDITVKTHGALTFAGGNGVYRIKNLNIEQNAEVSFSGGIYYIEQFNVKYRAKVYHHSGGTAVLYVNQDANFEQESRFNRYERASNFLLFANKNVNLKYASQSRLFIYSKEQVNVEQSAFLKGAINAKFVHMKYQSGLYWDIEAIGDLEGCGLGGGGSPSDELNLVGHWKANVCSLDGSVGELVDVIAGNNGQAVDGAGIEADGKFCQALRFNGDDANVIIPHSNDFALANGSLAFWFKANDLNHSSDRGQGGQGLWSKDSSGWNAGGDHLTIWLNSNGEIRVRHQTDDSDEDINLYSDSGSVRANRWYHLVYTWGSEGSHLYLDGDEEHDWDDDGRDDDDDDGRDDDDDDDRDDDDDDGRDDDDDDDRDDDDDDDNRYGSNQVRSLANNPEPIILGANAWVTEDYGSSSEYLKDKFKGQIDDIRLYSGQLDEDEVEDLYELDNPDNCEQCVVAEPELVAQYSSDVCDINGNGGAYVDVINGYNGIFIDGVDVRSGRFCNSVYFNGDDEHINIPHVSDFNIAEGAIAMWVNVPDLDFENIDDSIHEGQALFSKDSTGEDNGGKHLTIWVEDNGRVRVRHQTSGENEIETSSGVIREGNWHHIMYTWGRDGKRLYVDGDLKDSAGGFSQGIETNPEPIILGANASTTGNSVSEPSKLDNWFKGRIDDFRIYGSAQPDDDFVESVANEEVNCQQCMTPIAHYKFEGSSSVAFESETGQYNGSEFPDGNSGIQLVYGNGSSTLGSCQAMSVPFNNSGSERTAMDSGIDPDDIGPRGTISFWYQSNESWVSNRAKQLFDGSDRSKYFHGTILGDGRVMFGLEDKNDGDARVFTRSSYNFPANTWVHVAFVWDITSNTNMKIFINGIEQSVDKPLDTLRTSETNYNSTIFFGDNSHPNYLVGGSTGNSANGQFDDIRVYDVTQISANILTDMADISPCKFEVNRYKLEFPSSVASCAATDITVKACEDINCSNLASGVQQVWVGYEAEDGTTTPVVSALNLNNGSGIISNWRPASSGKGRFFVTSAAPLPVNTTVCNQPDCEIEFGDYQIEIVYTDGANVIDGTPVEISEQLFSVSTGAIVVRTPDACPQLENPTALKVAVECVNPAICSGNTFDILGTDNNVTRVNPVNQLGSGASIPDSRFVTFSDEFTGSELVLDDVLFNDAGEIKLHAQVAGQSVTQNIIVRPKYLKLTSNRHASDGSETITTAGEEFTMNVTAHGANNSVLPNYSSGDLQFALQRITPQEVNGSTSLSIANPANSEEILRVSDTSSLTQFTGNDFSVQPRFESGISADLLSVMPEVGRYAIDIRDANYLLKGSGVVGFIQSDQYLLDAAKPEESTDYDAYVFTRFIPAKFSLETTFDYSPTCAVSNFTFRGELIEASADGRPHSLVFTAKNALNQITRYYDAGTGSRNVDGAPSEAQFIAGQPVISDYAGTDSGKQGTGLRLTFMGVYTDSSQSKYSVWRIRNSADNTQQVTLDAYSGNWQASYDVTANSEFFIASPRASATHRLFLGNNNLDSKAAGNSVYNLSSSGGSQGQIGGSFKFALESDLFAARQYTAVTRELVQEGGNQQLQENNYSHISFFEDATAFVNETQSDGVFEYRFVNDNILFNKYFGTSQAIVNGQQVQLESAQPPIVNGTDVHQVSVRFNLATSLLRDSDDVSVALNEITETTGKSISVATINGIQYMVVDNLLDGIELRSGRIRLINSVTAELDTEVGIVSEFYAGNNNWQLNELDNCTTYDANNLEFMYVQNTISGTPVLDNNGVFEKGIGDGADAMTIVIDGFNGNNNSGVIDLGYSIPGDLNFLQYNWCGENSASTNHENTADSPPQGTPIQLVSCRNPIGQYTFGQERGNDRIIHWREVLR